MWRNFNVCKQASIFHTRACCWMNNCFNHWYVAGAGGWIIAGGGLGEGVPVSGALLVKMMGRNILWIVCPTRLAALHLVLARVRYRVPGCRAHLLLFKTIKHIDPQYGFIFLWVRLHVHPRRWYTNGCHPWRWYNTGTHPRSCITVGMKCSGCTRWYTRMPRR
jgi:hypothetical protein